MKLFVYGTLMQGEKNHHFLEDAEFLGEAMTDRGFSLISLGAFPGMIIGKGQVKGELYEIDMETRDQIDLLESHPRFYRRVRIRLEDGEWVESYLLPYYHYVKSTPIPSGDWRNVIREIPMKGEVE